MRKIFDALKDHPLFQGLAFNDFEKALDCLSARTASYRKNDVILLSGGRADFVGLLLSGGAKVIKEDRDGNLTILAELAAPEVFGEVFACAGIGRSPVTVQASEDCEALLIDYRKIVTTCPSACAYHTRLIENMLRLIANKSLLLNQKIEILSKRATREKLRCFFDIQRGSAKKFTIPYNREELAHYLCVDRSALSSELGRMRDDGLIRYKRNEFEVL